MSWKTASNANGFSWTPEDFPALPPTGSRPSRSSRRPSHWKGGGQGPTRSPSTHSFGAQCSGNVSSVAFGHQRSGAFGRRSSENFRMRGSGAVGRRSREKIRPRGRGTIGSRPSEIYGPQSTTFFESGSTGVPVSPDPGVNGSGLKNSFGSWGPGVNGNRSGDSFWLWDPTSAHIWGMWNSSNCWSFRPGHSKPSLPGIRMTPEGMIQDQYGIAGLLAWAYAENPHYWARGMLNLGIDFSTLEIIHYGYSVPSVERPSLPQVTECDVTPECRVYDKTREKIAVVSPKNLPVGLLFYIFYNFPGEIIQTVVAYELFMREWRFHLVEKMWMTYASGYKIKRFLTFEIGAYLFFDPSTWTTMMKEFTVEYSKLASKPDIPHHVKALLDRAANDLRYHFC